MTAGRSVQGFALASLTLALSLGPDAAPGPRPAEADLRAGAEKLLLAMDASLDPGCGRRSVVPAPPSAADATLGAASRTGPRVEQWTVVRCGRTVAWDVGFAPSAPGGTAITVRLASAPDAGGGAAAPASSASGTHGPVIPAAAQAADREPARRGRPDFLVTNTNDAGPGSLSQAILDANASPNRGGPELIQFRIEDKGSLVIRLAAALPVISDPLILDGASQPGVEIDGSALSRPADGLVLRAGSSTVRGLRLSGFAGDGLRIEGADNVIGGDAPVARNVIVDNGRAGVRIAGGMAARTAILGNAIVGNRETGIALESTASTVEGVPARPISPPGLASMRFTPRGPDREAGFTVEGGLEARPQGRYRIELYATSPRPASDAGPAPDRGAAAKAEGERLLGVAEVSTGEDGRAGFQFRLPSGIHGRDLLTATTTDEAGNTSEFSVPIEAQAVLVTWNTGAGNWGTATNWSPQQLPAAGDDVMIAANGANSTFTVTQNANASINSITVGGGSGTQTLTITGVTLTLAGASSVGTNGAVTLNGAIAGAGTLTVDGSFNWVAGTMSGAGATTVNGPLTFTTTGTKDLNTRILNAPGGATWTGVASLRVWNNAVVNNSGTWDFQADGSVFNPGFGGGATFANTGTLRKSTATGTTNMSIPLTNSGTLDVQTGTLTPSAGGSSTGAMNASAGAAVQFTAGTYNLDAGHTFGGAGTISVAGATVNVNAAVAIPAATTLAHQSGTIGGVGTLTTTGPFNWTGGTMTGAGVTTVNGALNVTTTAVHDLSVRTLNTTAATTWTGTGSIRLWSNAVINNSGTWDCQDDATIFNPGFGGGATFSNTGTFRKSTATGTTNVNIPFNNSNTVDVQTGTLLLSSGGTSSAAMTLAAGTNVTFSASTYNLNAGHTFSGPGSVNVNGSAATVNVNAGIGIPAATTLNLQAGTIGGTGTLTTTGPFNWTAGTMTAAGVTTVNGTLALSTTGTKDMSTRTLNTTAATSWSGGTIRLWSNAVINNSGTWDCQSDNTILNPGFGGGATLANTGTFRKSTATGTTNISITFNNSSTVDVQTGILQVSSGGASSAAVQLAAGTTITFTASTYALNAGHTFSGPGTVLVDGATVGINAAIGIPAATTLTLQFGTINGTGTLTTTGPFTWTGGTMNAAGVTTVNGTLAISGSGTKDLSTRTLNTTAATTWSGGGTIRSWGGATINNSGTWSIEDDAVIYNPGFGGAALFANTGTLRKATTATATTNVAIPLTNSSVVDVQAGTLQISGGGSSTAAVQLAPGTTVTFTDNTFALNAGHAFSGPGTVLVNGAIVGINTAIGIPAATTLTLAFGTINGTGTLTTTGPFNWTGGTMNAAGVTTVNGTLALGGTTKDLTTRVLNTTGTTTWSAGAMRLWGGAVINNSGTWDVQGDAALFNPGSGGTALLANTGTFRKTGGAGSTAISIPFTNTGTVESASGTLTVTSSNYTQTAGTTRINGGTLASTTNVNIQGGTLSGTGTVTAPVIVSGTGALAPGLSPGTLNLVGTYTQQSPNGAYNVELGGTTAGTQYDQVNISGASAVANLGGVLNVSFANGFFPSNGDTFTILTYPSRAGTFTANLPVLPCLGWQVTYGPTALVLTVTVVPTEITNLVFGTDNITLSWDPGPPQAGTTYDVLRGNLDRQPVGTGTGQACMAQGITATTITDATQPAIGSGWWYLVREKVTTCGIGTYGRATNNTERTATACP